MIDPSRGARLRVLDAVRGIAILLVLAWHYLPQPWWPVRGAAFHALRAANAMSWSGVDLFFVLSGFLIGGILIDHRDARNYYRTFYIRRVCRILPLYLLVLSLALLSLDRSRWLSLWPFLIFQQNAVTAATGNWGPKYLEVTWSLAIEEQFYLLAPLLIRRLPARRLPAALVAVVALALLTRILVWALLPPGVAMYAAFTLLPCRMDALALGVLVAWAARDEAGRRWLADRRLLGIAAGVSGLFGVAVPLAFGWAWPAEYVSTVGFTLVAVFYATGLAWTLTLRSDVLAKSAVGAVVSWAGIGAYSMYLFHLSIRNALSPAMTARTGVAAWAAYLAALVGANAAVALACWWAIERPLIAIGHRHRYQA